MTAAKFYILFVLCCCTVCITSAQDKIITQKGDTLDVSIPGDPWRELKINYSNLGQSLDYGFLRVAVVYKPDSIRIHEPTQLKAYFKKEAGKHLGSGYFESGVVYENQLQVNPKYRTSQMGEPRHVFRQLIYRSSRIAIWYYREHATFQQPDSYYFVELPGEKEPAVFIKYSEWITWTERHPPFAAIADALPTPSKKPGSLFGYFAEVGKMYTER